MNKTQILFVGDFDKDFLVKMTCEDWQIKQAYSSKEALDLMAVEPITLVIAKDKIDELNGYQFGLLIKSHPHTFHLPLYILGEKKQIGESVPGSLFCCPDRIAEYGEVIKKPGSLMKLLQEDLKQMKFNSPPAVQTGPLLPASSTETDAGTVARVIDELLLERFISSRMLKMAKWPKAKSQYLTEYFSALNELLDADLFGIGVSTLYKPWLAFSGIKNLNQKSFAGLTDKVKENFLLGQEMEITTAPLLVDKGGATISDFMILPYIEDSSASGCLVFAKCNDQKFTKLERAKIGYISQYSMPIFQFLFAEQAMNKLLTREAVKASVDPLTGLYNLEFLVGFLQQQLLFSFRNKLPVSLLMIDIDSFAQINNALGQAVADTILVKVAERILTMIRGSDLLSHYSGDKFVVVLPNTPAKGAKVVAEKIRLEIEQTNFFAGRQQGPSITVSIGVAEYDTHDLNPETILKDAKIALQKAKENGRNKVAL